VDRVRLSEWDSLEKYSPESFRPPLEDWQEFRDFLRLFPPDFILRICLRDQNEFLTLEPNGGVWLRGDEEATKLWIDDLLIAFRLFKNGLFSHAGPWFFATGTLMHDDRQTKIALTSSWLSRDEITVRSLRKCEYHPWCC
jgi:hypothetical protein